MKKSKKYILAIDSGKFNMKATDGKKEVIYANKYSEKLTDTMILGKNTFNTQYEGSEYTIGNNATRRMKGNDKTNEMHILSTLVAITHFIPVDEEVNIYMTYGEAVNNYYNPNIVKAIQKALKGKHEIVVDDKKFNFNIKDVKIVPEGLGELLIDLEKYSGVQYFGDFGGSTFNFVTTQDGRPNEKLSKSFALGFRKIRATVAEMLERSGRTLPTDILDQYIRSGANDPAIQNVIDSVVQELFEDVDEKLLDYGIDIHEIVGTHGMTFLGGVADLLEEHITSYYKGAKVVKESVFANVRGFYVYAYALFGDEVEEEAN